MSTKHVICIAVASRIACCILAYLAKSFGTAYDSSSGLQVVGCSPLVNPSSLKTPGYLCSNSVFVWDSVFFTRIALCGYEYEQYYAFFPFLPGLLRLGMTAVQALDAFMCADAALWVASTCLSLAAFVVSAVNLHKLSKAVLKDDRVADLATLLYIWNPASVFYSAAYTESTFACAAFTGLYLLGQQPWLATICLSIATASRSNGVLHCWFMLHKLAKVIVHRQRQELLFQDAELFSLLLQSGLQCCLVCLPVLLFQLSGWLSFCCKGIVERPWCVSSLPNIYSFVQSFYWGVGFLRYFKVQQIPNFLLATPILYLSTTGCYKYVSQDWTRTVQLGLLPPCASSSLGSKPQSRKGTGKMHSRIVNTKACTNATRGFYSADTAPYVHQWAIMTACALLVMNVQVATRFLSACPAVYWYAASGVKPQASQWIWGYFLAYFCLGNVLFTLFYPWT